MNKKQKPRRLSEEKRKFNRYYKEILKNWNRSIEKLTTIFDETIFSDDNHVTEIAEILILAERFMNWYKKKIQDNNTERFEVVMDLIIRNKIHYVSQVFLWYEINFLSKKHWITEKFKIKYLQKARANRVNYLENGCLMRYGSTFRNIIININKRTFHAIGNQTGTISC